MVIINCAFPGCDYRTEDAAETIASVIFQSHVYGHARIACEPTQNNSPAKDVSAPRLIRPQVDAGISLEEWNIFVRRWNVFKQGSGIDDSAAPSQLFHCASQALGDLLLKSDADIMSKSLPDLMQAMKRLAIIPISTGVLRSELMQMRQSHSEPFRSFAARVRGKADTCSFHATCTCGLSVDYTDHVIRDTLLNGIADSEIQREALGFKDIITTPINDVIALTESKEMARNAVPTPADISAASALRQRVATLTPKPIPDPRTTPRHLPALVAVTLILYTKGDPGDGTQNPFPCVCLVSGYDALRIVAKNSVPPPRIYRPFRHL